MLLQGGDRQPGYTAQRKAAATCQGESQCKKDWQLYHPAKVADKLEEIFNKERASFEEKWESIGLFCEITG